MVARGLIQGPVVPQVLHTVGDKRPPIILALHQYVQFISTTGTVLGRPDSLVRGDVKALGIPVSFGKEVASPRGEIDGQGLPVIVAIILRQYLCRFPAVELMITDRQEDGPVVKEHHPAPRLVA